jgi:hypothetical protein
VGLCIRCMLGGAALDPIGNAKTRIRDRHHPPRQVRRLRKLSSFRALSPGRITYLVMGYHDTSRAIPKHRRFLDSEG